MKLLKYNIRWKSIFGKGVKKINDDFFVGMICGAQGTGKNWFAILLLLDNPNRNIITNIHSLKLPNRNIKYFTKIEEVYQWDDKDCIVLIDECSKKWPKESKQDIKFYSWLMQSRKHGRYVYLIFQEYIQTPTWIRGVANRIYTTNKAFFGKLCKTSLGVPVLNEETKEWETENFAYTLYKRNYYISTLYDTYERIESL